MAPQRTLLYLAREYLFPLNSAVRLRTFNWLLHLSKRFQVTLVAPARHEPSAMEREALEGRCHFILVPCTTAAPTLGRLPQRLWNTARHAFTGIPADEQPLMSGPVKRAVHRLLREKRFHVAFVERWSQVDLAHAAAPYTMLDAGELQTPKQVADVQHMRNPLQRLWRSRLLSNQATAEAKALSRFDLILLNGGLARKEVVRVIGSSRATLALPAGLDTTHFAPETSGIDPRRIVFYTSLKSFNQQDALYYLCQDVLPRVRRRFGTVRLTVISPQEPAELRELLQADPDIEFLGPVDDPRPILQSSALAVLPLRLGKGSRSRLMQLLAMGIPTVATPLATAGLDLVSGDGLLIAKDAADFSDAILQILEDASLRQDLAYRGRALAESRLSLHATYENLTEALSTLSLDIPGALR